MGFSAKNKNARSYLTLVVVQHFQWNILRGLHFNIAICFGEAKDNEVSCRKE